MKMRRVVTGHDPGGKAVIASDVQLEGVQVALLPGLELHALWGGDQPPGYPDDGSAMPAVTWFPPVAGFRFFHMVLPPEGGELRPLEDPAAAIAEMEAKVPGLLATMEPDQPGMHRSDTVDFLYVLSGNPVLELDDGVEVSLRPGDTLVQSGTRHRWHNRGIGPCRMVGAHIGARRAG